MEKKAWFSTLQNGSLLSCPGIFFLLKVTYSSLFDRKIIYLKYKKEVIKEELSVRRRIQTRPGSALKLALIRNNGKAKTTFDSPYLKAKTCERMCLMGGTAYHLEHTRHWWDCFPPGPTWDRVSLLISCSTGILPGQKSFLML
jgi:hypothetical protein